MLPYQRIPDSTVPQSTVHVSSGVLYICPLAPALFSSTKEKQPVQILRLLSKGKTAQGGRGQGRTTQLNPSKPAARLVLTRTAQQDLAMLQQSKGTLNQTSFKTHALDQSYHRPILGQNVEQFDSYLICMYCTVQSRTVPYRPFLKHKPHNTISPLDRSSSHNKPIHVQS